MALREFGDLDDPIEHSSDSPDRPPKAQVMVVVAMLLSVSWDAASTSGYLFLRFWSACAPGTGEETKEEGTGGGSRPEEAELLLRQGGRARLRHPHG